MPGCVTDETALETVVEIDNGLAETVEVDVTLERVEVLLPGTLAEPREEVVGADELGVLPVDDGVVSVI